MLIRACLLVGTGLAASSAALLLPALGPLGVLPTPQHKKGLAYKLAAGLPVRYQGWLLAGTLLLWMLAPSDKPAQKRNPPAW